MQTSLFNLKQCFCNTKCAYKYNSLLILGKGDHDMVYLCPIYKPKIQTLPIEKKEVRVWDESACEKLRSCFDCTELKICYETWTDIDVFTSVVNKPFCEKLCSETKTVKCFLTTRSKRIDKQKEVCICKQRQGRNKKE